MQAIKLLFNLLHDGQAFARGAKLVAVHAAEEVEALAKRGVDAVLCTRKELAAWMDCGAAEEIEHSELAPAPASSAANTLIVSEQAAAGSAPPPAGTPIAAAALAATVPSEGDGSTATGSAVPDAAEAGSVESSAGKEVNNPVPENGNAEATAEVAATNTHDHDDDESTASAPASPEAAAQDAAGGGSAGNPTDNTTGEASPNSGDANTDANAGKSSRRKRA
jgi:hypothetical protein